MSLTNEDLLAISQLLDTKLKVELQPLKNDMESVKSDMQDMKSKMDKIESETLSLKAGQQIMRQEIREVRDKVNDTYNLALDAWGTSTENRVLINQL